MTMTAVRANSNASYNSISDFFRNATATQKKEVFLSTLAEANRAQRKVMEQAELKRKAR